MKIILISISAFLAVPAVQASNIGDYYDNRDGDHARLNLTNHPEVTYMSSGYGPQRSVINGKVVIGNASLAFTTGDYWGSLGRNDFMLSSNSMSQAYQLYINNNAYWYPEHRDHDLVDHYPSMSPTVNNSQGSSSSELDELDKWFYALNAFQPPTKEKLKQTGLLMPTIQMIARRTRVASDAAYLTGAAHPNAFDNFANKIQMEEMAASMPSDKIPPMVRLKVLDDSFKAIRGIDFFEASGTEKLFDTPVSIARLFRGREYTKIITVSAVDSYDANNLPLAFHWSVIRGDASHVRIVPLNSAGSEVKIEIDYHPKAVIDSSGRTSNLVVVGAFANNGTYYSAPAFVTSFTMENEEREYDGSGRLNAIRYNSNYTHPSLSNAKSWESDVFLYNNQGQLAGWTRQRGAETFKFSKEGYQVTATDPAGNPTRAVEVSYLRDATIKKIVWKTVGSDFPYSAEWDTLSPKAPRGLNVR